VRALAGPSAARPAVPDWLPALINAARAFVTIGLVALFWIVTAWPSGALAMTFAAIVILIASPRADQAYTFALAFLLGTCIAAMLAAIIKFAVLPQTETFTGFVLAIGIVLVPAGSLVAQPWQTPMFTALAANFTPLLAPSNLMIYDTQQFYNSAVAIVAGVGAAAVAIRLLPPLSPPMRARRLLALTLRDLRNLAKRRNPQTKGEWESSVYSRLLALPEEAEPLQRAWLSAVLSLGSEIIRLREIAPRFNVRSELDAVLDALARGQSATAIEGLARLDRALAALPDAAPGARVRLRARGSILAMTETLRDYGVYFDTGAFW